MQQPNLDHATHDLVLIAAHAADDIREADRSRAEALLASCPDCADLQRDLLAIADATHSLPAPLARRRDFQIEPAQADRLRRGSWLRRVLRPFGTAGSPARPLAAALTTLGIAGLLFATALPGLAGGAATSAPQRDALAGAAATAAPAAAPAATTASAPGVPGPTAGGPTSNPADFGADEHASGAPAASSSAVKAEPSQAAVRGAGGVGTPSSGGTVVDDGTESTQPALLATASTPNLLIVGSLGLLVVGLLLFGVRFASRRVR